MKKAKTVLICTASVMLLTAVIFAVLFFTAKPVFGQAVYRPVPEKIISAYTFDGMSFEPAFAYAARNYTPLDSGYGQSSRTSALYNAVNEKITASLSDYLDNRYSEYFINGTIAENTLEKTVIKFEGDAVYVDSEERTVIEFKLVLDWKKAIEKSNDFAEIIRL